MLSKKIIDKVKKISVQEESASYEELVKEVEKLSVDEIMELSRAIGYPVFIRLCMGKLKHKFVLLQDGASAVILNDKGQILLQSRADRNKWSLPGGCQEIGERFQDTIIREIKEETNLDVKEEDLELVDIVSGPSRKRDYPNGDIVFNNTVLYFIKNYSGKLKWNKESKEMRFFDLDKLPDDLMSIDLVEAYINSLNKTA